MKILSPRRWLVTIAEDANARVGLNDRDLAEIAARDAVRLLNLAPWHFRILIGGAESAASLWRLFYWLRHAGSVDPAREIEAFAKTPVISAPLLRLYRSLVFSSWFEQPQVLTALGAENAEARRARFRSIRRASA